MEEHTSPQPDTVSEQASIMVANCQPEDRFLDLIRTVEHVGRFSEGLTACVQATVSTDEPQVGIFLVSDRGPVSPEDMFHAYDLVLAATGLEPTVHRTRSAVNTPSGQEA